MTTLKQILFFSFCFLASTITMRGGNYITSLELVEQYTPCGDLNGHRLRVKGFLPSSSHKIDNIFISGISTEYTINVVNTGEIGTTALVPFDTLLGNIHSNTTVNYAIDGVAIEHEVKEYAPTSLPVTSSSCISSPSTISGCSFIPITLNYPQPFCKTYRNASYLVKDDTIFVNYSFTQGSFGIGCNVTFNPINVDPLPTEINPIVILPPFGLNLFGQSTFHLNSSLLDTGKYVIAAGTSTVGDDADVDYNLFSEITISENNEINAPSTASMCDSLPISFHFPFELCNVFTGGDFYVENDTIFVDYSFTNECIVVPFSDDEILYTTEPNTLLFPNPIIVHACTEASVTIPESTLQTGIYTIAIRKTNDGITQEYTSFSQIEITDEDCNITALSNFNSNNRGIFYPSPANETLTISTDYDLVSIYDFSGKLKLQEVSNKTLDVSGLEHGLHIIEIQSNGETIRQTFMKE